MMSQEPIPVYTNLDDLYQNLGSSLDHSVRWNELAREFTERFGRKPAFIARAPGRVNLIGEHVDYTLFGVIPTAIERDILIACAPRQNLDSSSTSGDAHLERSNIAQEAGIVVADNLHAKYNKEVFSPERRHSELNSRSLLSQESVESDGSDNVHLEEWHLDIDTKNLRWESYVKAGYFGVLNHCFQPSANVAHRQHFPVPVDLLVTGSVPAGSGLSSSAAMVVASTLAFLAVNGKLDESFNNFGPDVEERITKGKLVELAMENERRVGVNSGGMDQAASVMSLPSSAVYVSFYPSLSVQPTPLPAKAIFICANSLVVADKAVAARSQYNVRVLETLCGAQILARGLGLVRAGDHVGWKNGRYPTLREIIGAVIEREQASECSTAGNTTAKPIEQEAKLQALKLTLTKVMTEMGQMRIPYLNVADTERGMSMKEMIDLCGMTEIEFRNVYSSSMDVNVDVFKPYRRTRHVLSEALRVLEFRQICLDAANTLTIDSTAAVLKRLGKLMDASQESCAKDFECSCPELNELTKLAKEAGAYGSRLTGAGWGGCTVSLVAESEVESFIARMKKSYAPYRNLHGEALREVIFATKPSSGACVYKFD